MYGRKTRSEPSGGEKISPVLLYFRHRFQGRTDISDPDSCSRRRWFKLARAEEAHGSTLRFPAINKEAKTLSRSALRGDTDGEIN